MGGAPSQQKKSLLDPKKLENEPRYFDGMLGAAHRRVQTPEPDPAGRAKVARDLKKDRPDPSAFRRQGTPQRRSGVHLCERHDVDNRHA